MNPQINAFSGTHQIRPTLILGLGGTGHRIAVQLKSLVLQSWTEEQIANHVRFLVFDTAQEELILTRNGHTVTMEPGTEYFDIGQTPIEKIKRNLAQQPAIEARLGSVINNLSPTVLRNGAKQLRPLGLLAFLWRYAEIEEQLKSAIWSLANRQHHNVQEEINVFIVNSLVGGTGSSTFIDVAYVVRELLDELGTRADFCYITGVGVLPRAFHGINGPNLVPNAVASLKELNHCMMRGRFNVRYPNGRLITTAQPPFNIFYLVDGVDERGHTWRGPNEVCRLAAEAIFLQMGSQVGQKHDNDFDNLDDVLVRQTDDGDGTFHGSFGLASLVFPGVDIANQCAARQAKIVIDQGLLCSPQPAGDDHKTQNTAEYIETAELLPARLAERLAMDDQNLPLAVDLSVPGWVARLSRQAVPAELIRYVNNYEQARLNADFRRFLTQNESRLLSAECERLADYVTRLAQTAGLLTVQSWLEEFCQWLEDSATQLVARQTENDSRQVTLAQELSHLELAFLQAGESGFLGRGRRIARAQHAYMTTAQNLLELRWDIQVTTATLGLIQQLLRHGRDHLSACAAVVSRIRGVRRRLADLEIQYSTPPELEGVTTRTLADQALIESIFQRHAPLPPDTMAAIFSENRSPLDWYNQTPAVIEGELLKVCRPAFAVVATMNVEQVIALQNGDVSPDSYHTWLVDQATPSWNLDRTRLPDGGAALQKLEVLGVPDENGSLYRQYAKTLVSTGDPSRLTAFVARIGAAHTAIQQWDSYLAVYEQARGQVPLHILPQFQADNTRARQTFALGTLFGFITNQGAYFYYIPADPLERQVKLGQGLANSLQTFINKDKLVNETRERVEQLVATRGIEATLHSLSRYYENSPNGRYSTDDLVLELKRLVRAYADDLQQINQFAPVQNWPPGDDTEMAPAGREQNNVR